LKTAEISGTKRGNMQKTELLSLQRTVRTRTSKIYIRGINEFKRNNLVKEENGDLLANFHNILNRWKNNFSQLLNVHNVSHVGQKFIELNH
jgi:uncharacterized membrane protein